MAAQDCARTNATEKYIFKWLVLLTIEFHISKKKKKKKKKKGVLAESDSFL